MTSHDPSVSGLITMFCQFSLPTHYVVLPEISVPVYKLMKYLTFNISHIQAVELTNEQTHVQKHANGKKDVKIVLV